jgi:hypothetical protein
MFGAKPCIVEHLDWVPLYHTVLKKSSASRRSSA